MRPLALLILLSTLALAQADQCVTKNLEQFERDFKQAAKTHDSDRIIATATDLARRYELLGQRNKLRETVTRVEKMRGAQWGAALETLKTAQKAFGDYPDQVVASRAASRIEYAYVDRKLTVPMTINGAAANYIIDTGGPENTMSAAEAKRLGLIVHDAPLQAAYVFYEAKPAGIAMADELVIGNLHLKNVLFQVIPDALPGILGLPIVMAMETLRWNSDGTLEFGFKAPREANASSICLLESSPMLRAEIANREALMTLDTGSDMTLLFPRFARDFSELAKLSSPGNAVILGDRVKDPQARLMDELFMRAGGVRLRAPNAVLLSKDISGPTPAHGLIGMDAMEQVKSITLDFVAMKMAVEGIDAVRIAAGHESVCPLPPAYACAAGSRCTMQTDADNEICLLERVPREQWAGNPVIDDVIEAGKRCPLGENLSCPAGKSCRAVFQSNQSCAFVIQDQVALTEEAGDSASAAPDSKPPAAAAANAARDIMRKVLKYDLFEIAPPRDYVYLEDHETKHLNSDGSAKDVTTETREVMNLYDAEYSRLIRRNGVDLPAGKARAEQAKFDKAVDRRAHETPEAKEKREAAERKQAEKNHVCEEAILSAFEFRVTGTEEVNGRAAWIVEADPLAQMGTGCVELTALGYFKQKFWIDQADFRMAKWEGDTGSFHIGGILLRVPNEGIHFTYEQRRNEDGAWLVVRETSRMNVRMLGVKTIHQEDTWTYSNYRKFGAELRMVR